MERDDIIFLNQLISSLEESEKQLEKASTSKDYEAFNKSKRTMIALQKEITGVLK